MTAIDDALASNAADPHPRGELVAEPTARLAVVTCMDARLDPLRDLGIEVGAAHVLRNAGGRVTDDVLRSLLLSWHVLGTREVLVVHHTRCGVLADDEDAVRSRLSEVVGFPVEVPLRTFSDEQAGVREDVAAIRAAPFAPQGLEVRGAIHDVDTGIVRVVAEE